MSNRSYTLLIPNSHQAEKLFEFLELIETEKGGCSLGSLSGIIRAERNLRRFGEVKKGSILANIIIDRADLWDSIINEHGIDWPDLKFWTLDGFALEDVVIPDDKLREQHEEFKATWDFETYKRRYGTYCKIKGAKYLESKNDKETDFKGWTCSEVIALL